MGPDAVVLQLGDLATKAGFAGEDYPAVVVPHPDSAAHGPFDFRPRFCRVLAELRASLSQHPICVVCFTDSDGKEQLKEALTQFCFEDFHACAFYLADPLLMSLYSAGLTTGVVVMAEGLLRVACIYEGYVVRRASAGLSAGGAAALEWGCGAFELTASAIRACDAEIQAMLWDNIVVAGEAMDRLRHAMLQEHLQQRFPGEKIAVKFQDQDHGAWRGAALLVSLPTLCGFWIHAEQYDESGPRIVHRMCP